MNEQELIEKLRLIEALFAGAATKGEKTGQRQTAKKGKNEGVSSKLVILL